MAVKVSTKPWSQFTEADYSLEQWHRACLLHLHEGKPDAKSQCKVPVLEPDGTPNRNGMIAAAMALTVGLRGNKVKAPKEARCKAIRKLARMFRQHKMTDLGVYQHLLRALKSC